jgi:anti-anti-sigma factor
MTQGQDSPARALPAFLIVERDPLPDGTMRMALRGHLDADGAAELQEHLENLLEKGVRRVELDFTQVPFISSSGVGSLISSIGEYRDDGGDIVLARLSSGLRGVLKMLDLLDYVTLSQG